jgi:hypothetical protein
MTLPPGKYQKLLSTKGPIGAAPKKAVDWYKDSAGKVRAINAREFMEDPASHIKKTSNLSEAFIGKMCMFFYDPKHKDTLPFYDRYPLIFPIEWYKDGSMLGINLHYLPPALRAKLLDALESNLLLNKGKPDKEKLAISYKILAGASKSFSAYPGAAPCIKKYLLSHVRSKFQIVPSEHWDKVIFLPLERFEKANKSEVWADSRKKMAKVKKQNDDYLKQFKKKP